MLALEDPTRRKVRTSLTVAGGVASVVALVAVSRGMRGQLDDMFAEPTIRILDGPIVEAGRNTPAVPAT